jgi:hypothetical protein
VYLVGALTFILLGSGETQEWAKRDEGGKSDKLPNEQNEEEMAPLKKV